MAYICNAALIILEIVGLKKRRGGFSWKMFAYYTQLSNAVALVSAVLFLILREKAAPVRYLACCMLLMTVFVTVCILIPMGAGAKRMLLTENGLYHHLLCPAVSVISYIFWEPHVKMWLLPAMLTLVYGLTMEILNGLGKYDGPYPFFRVRNQSAGMTVLWTIVLFGVISGFSILLMQV